MPELKRVTADGTTTYTLAHSLISGSAYNATNTVVDAGNNTAVYTFTGFTATGNAAAPTLQPLTQVQKYQGASTLLTTDVYCYNTAFTSCSFTGAVTATVTSPITTLVVLHKINGMSAVSATESHYDIYGNVTYTAQYDLGGTTPTRVTTTTYGTWTGTTCASIGNFVNDKPCDVLTTQNGYNVAEVRFTYDYRGNLLQTSEWTGSAWIGQSTLNTYNGNGSPIATYDLANNPTTYTYNSASYTQCGSCVQFPFPTSISKGGLSRSSTWNGYGGVKVTDVDANGNTTTYNHSDVFNRLLETDDPLGNKAATAYLGDPTFIQYTLNYNSGSYGQYSYIQIDGYGRRLNVQTEQPSGSTYDTVSTAYGWSGNYRTVATSQPCTATLTIFCPTVHTTYVDPLGRLSEEITTYNEEVTHTYTQNDDLSILSFPPSGENSKQVQTQYDGLGRPTSICAISAVVSGVVACGQSTNTTATGVLTTLAYTSGAGSQTVSSSRGSQARRQTYDALGRVTVQSTPEGGTWYYYYDTAVAPCPGSWNSNGNLTCIKDPNGNQQSLLYDSLNRVTDIGPGTSAAPVCKRFRYDNTSGVRGAIPTGVSLSNQYGHLVEAETDDCAIPVLAADQITDEWFSYDKDGHMTDMWELTPHSGTYYHSHATVAGNGFPLTVQLANPSLYTETYGLDFEGRLATLSSSGTTIVAGTTYNASSQPTYIDLGTRTDQDQYGWDPNTGRMKTWLFQVGSASESGTLTWNANGTLLNLAIADGFNSGGSQTCTFGTSTVMGYDDLGRLMSDNCGAVWQQTFSYDQYDNLTKAGSSSWNPGYNSTNNRYSTGATYDNNGNVTRDPSHTYAWDGYSKLLSIDSGSCASNGECITYDAFGHIVETSYQGVFTEIWYTQAGKVYMHGNTPYYAYWPTPGNGTVEINGNNVSSYYMHKDWLGNSRISSVISSSQVVSDQAYGPYGEVYNKQASGAGTPAQMFTGDTQDVIGGIFDTPNRGLNSSQSRWLSPDPANSGWNRYAYATNPNSFVDPSGLDIKNCMWDGGCGTPCNAWCNWGGGGGGGSGIGGLGSDPSTPSGGIFFTGSLWDTEKQWESEYSPFVLQFQGTMYGKSYAPRTFASWDDYADWRMDVAALPASQVYAAFAVICQNQGCDPNESVQVRYQNSNLVWSVWHVCDAGQGCSVAQDNLDGFWPDPITYMHNGDSSWYEGFFYDTPHLIDSDPLGAHIDPFGPLNPFHYLIQMPAMKFPAGQSGTANCSVNGGCSFP